MSRGTYLVTEILCVQSEILRDRDSVIQSEIFRDRDSVVQREIFRDRDSVCPEGDIS